MEFFCVSREETLQALGVDPKRGLSAGECQRRRARYGRNELQAAKRRGVLLRFFSQFQDLMVLILLAAAGVSFAVSWARGDGEYVDSLIILAIVVVNARIGTIQELRADKAIEALKKLSSPHAQVLRDGRRQRVESWELVPGDIVILQAGDLVPADLRLLRSVELKAEESALTGESVPAEKDGEALCPANAPLGERRNVAFASTGVASGAGVGVVTATGMDTAMGRIARMLESEKAPQTPLQLRLKQTGKVLGIGVVLICGVIFLLGLLQRMEPLEMFMIAISLGVAAIPEGLTAVVTIVLAMGIKRHCPLSARCGNPGQHPGDLLGQNRHPHPEQDDGGGLFRSPGRGAAGIIRRPVRAGACHVVQQLPGGGKRLDWRSHGNCLSAGVQAGKRRAGGGLSPGGGNSLQLCPKDDDHRSQTGGGRIPDHLQGCPGRADCPVYGDASGERGAAPFRRHEGEVSL